MYLTLVWSRAAACLGFNSSSETGDTVSPVLGIATRRADNRRIAVGTTSMGMVSSRSSAGGDVVSLPTWLGRGTGTPTASAAYAQQMKKPGAQAKRVSLSARGVRRLPSDVAAHDPPADPDVNAF